MPIFMDGKAYKDQYDLQEGRVIPVMDDSNFRKSDNIDDRRAEPEEQGPLHPNDLRGGWLPQDNMETLNEQSVLSAQLGGNDLDINNVQDWNDSRFPNYKDMQDDKLFAEAEANKKLEEEYNKPQDISDDQIDALLKRLASKDKSEVYKKLEQLEIEMGLRQE